MKDLIILVADKNTQFVMEGLLQRHQAFGVRPFSYDIFVHPLRDPGVYNDGANILRPFQSQYEKALIFLDREGSGQENKTADEIAATIKTKAETMGWRERIEVIVFDPELEIWAWTQSPHLAVYLGWDNLHSLVSFIQEKGFWESGHPKPERPKEAIEIALKEKRIPRSSSIYKKIAETVNFRKCQEPSFLKFKETLVNWFAIGDQK